MFGRIFVAVFLALAFVCSLFADQSIFALGTWSLTGFAGLLPVFAASLYWRRSAKAGAAAAIGAVAGLWAYFFVDFARRGRAVQHCRVGLAADCGNRPGVGCCDDRCVPAVAARRRIPPGFSLKIDALRCGYRFLDELERMREGEDHAGFPNE